MPHTLTRSASDLQRSAQILGSFIHGARALDDRPLEQIAPLAALTVDEWLAIEAGEAPDTWDDLTP